MDQTPSAQSSTNVSAQMLALKLSQASNTSLSLVSPIKLDRNNYLLWKPMILPVIKNNSTWKFHLRKKSTLNFWKTTPPHQIPNTKNGSTQTSFFLAGCSAPFHLTFSLTARRVKSSSKILKSSLELPIRQKFCGTRVSYIGQGKDI